MTCKLGYSSEYINGCDISKFGEGCERCVNLFYPWSGVIFLISGIVIFLGIIILILQRLIKLKKKEITK